MTLLPSSWANARHCCATKNSQPVLSKDVIDLIQDMWRSNPTWGSPRIVGELRKLGINVAKSTVEKYRPRVRKPPAPTWKAFLNR
jgi:putative transposase